MNRIRSRNAILLSLLSVASSFVAIAFSASASSGQSGALSAKSVRVPAPESCIKLLEDILQRLHNMPALAMKSAEKQQFAYQAATDSLAQQGPTNQLLAIKPKETTFTYGFPSARTDSRNAKDLFMPKMKKASHSSAISAATPAGSAGIADDIVNGNEESAKSLPDSSLNSAPNPKRQDLGQNLANLRGALSMYAGAPKPPSPSGNKSAAIDRTVIRDYKTTQETSYTGPLSTLQGATNTIAKGNVVQSVRV